MENTSFSSNTVIQTKLVYQGTQLKMFKCIYFDQPIAIKRSIGSMKRQTDTRNYHKIHYNKNHLQIVKGSATETFLAPY